MSDLCEILTTVDVQEGLKRLRGNRKLYIKLLINFAHTYPGYVEEIRRALFLNDLEEAGRLNHTLKGVAGNLSAHQLRLAAERLGEAIKSEKAWLWPERLQEMETELKLLIHSINSIETPTEEKPLPTGLASSGKILSRQEKIAPKICRLHQMLSRYNLKALSYLESFESQLADTFSSKKLSRMENQIADLDFKSARTTLEKMAAQAGISIPEAGDT